MMASYGFPDNPSLTTSSGLRAWWLEHMRGYKVLQVRHYPREGWFGHVKLEATYLMLPKRYRD